MQVPNSAFMRAALSDVEANLLLDATDHVTVHLVAAPFSPNFGTDPATLTAPTFAGYAPVNVTAWGTPHLNAASQWIIAAATAVRFTPGDDLVTDQIYGYYLKDIEGNCIACEVFANPVTLSSPTTTLQFVPGVGLGGWSYTAPIVP